MDHGKLSIREKRALLLAAQFPDVQKNNLAGRARRFEGALAAPVYLAYTSYERELDGLDEAGLDQRLAEAAEGLSPSLGERPKAKMEGTQAYAARMIKAARERVAALPVESFLRPPNWAAWRHLPECAVWEAVCLSFDIEPDDSLYRITDWLNRHAGDFRSTPSGFPADFGTRMRITGANIGPRSAIKNASSAGRFDNPHQHISLGEFAAFAERTWGNAVPSELRELRPESERLREAQEVGEIAELLANGGRGIDWPRWMRRPRWLTADASRLMTGLDPDRFADLSHDAARDREYRSTKPRATASRMERLAIALGMAQATPKEWLDWAGEHFAGEVHMGFIAAVLGANEATQVNGHPAVAMSVEATQAAAPSPWQATNDRQTDPLHVANTVLPSGVLAGVLGDDAKGVKEWKDRFKDPADWLGVAIAQRGQKPHPHRWWALCVADAAVMKRLLTVPEILQRFQAARASPEVALCIPAVEAWARRKVQEIADWGG